MSFKKPITREDLIQLKLIIPASYYSKLPKDDPSRHAYEMRVILAGIDPAQGRAFKPKENN